MKVDMEATGSRLNIQDADWITKLVRVLDEFRKVNQKVTANQVVSFLQVALRDNITQKELEQETGLDNGTVSRICAILSDRGLKGRDAEPMNLIRINMNGSDFRGRVQTLAPNGKRVLNSLRAIMKGR